MRPVHHPVTATAGLLAAGLLMSGCGSSGSPGSGSSATASAETAAKLLPEVKAAVKSATSVHMTGTAISDGQKISFDMNFYGKGDMSGTMSYSSGSIKLLVVGRNAYFKLDAGFLKAQKLPAAACSLVCGKYLEEPGSASQFASGLSMTGLSGQAMNQLPGMTRKAMSKDFVPATVDGQSVLQFRNGGSTIDVSASGTPYLIRVNTAGDNITFSDWNGVPAPTAPPASQIVNLSQL
jgi:hypothetical protein